MPKSVKKTLALVVPAVVAVLIGFFRFGLPALINNDHRDSGSSAVFAGTVSDEHTGKVLPAVKVSLHSKGLSPVVYTDSEGRFSFPITSEHEEIIIRVDARGYRPFERRIRVSAKTEPEDIRLTIEDSLPTPSPVQTDTPQKVTKSQRRLSRQEQEKRALEDLHSNSPALRH